MSSQTRTYPTGTTLRQAQLKSVGAGDGRTVMSFRERIFQKGNYDPIFFQKGNYDWHWSCSGLVLLEIFVTSQTFPV